MNVFVVYILQLKCVQYWPNLQTSMESGSFMIHSIEEKQYAFYIVRKLTVTNKKVQFRISKKEHFFLPVL